MTTVGVTGASGYVDDTRTPFRAGRRFSSGLNPHCTVPADATRREGHHPIASSTGFSGDRTGPGRLRHLPRGFPVSAAAPHLYPHAEEQAPRLGARTTRMIVKPVVGR